jgi:glucokinase
MEHQGQWQGRLLETVLSSIERVTAEAGIGLDQVGAFGVAVAGLVSKDQSTLVHSPIIRETHFDLGVPLSGRLGRPVIVENDANATLYGLARHARSTSDQSPDESQVALLLTLGTGVGGAIMVGDRIIVGEHGFATELGHVTVDYADDRTCVCGNRGCIEQFSSGRGIEELAVVTPPPAASVATLLALSAKAPYTARDIVAAAERGDPWATSLLRLCGAMLGRAISILCVALDPTTVTIGGSFGHAAGPWLLPAALDEMRNRWTYARERPLPQLTMDSIGPYAAATGAAMLAAANFEKDKAQ